MRLWSVHPSYLDSKGLVALWREGLLAKKILEGKTRGYRHHPQLIRFRRQKDPLSAINAYLEAVLSEALLRGFNFDASKVTKVCGVPLIRVTSGQLLYEWNHLLYKLSHRAPDLYEKLKSIRMPEPHPIMVLVPGDVEPWEVVR